MGCQCATVRAGSCLQVGDTRDMDSDSSAIAWLEATPVIRQSLKEVPLLLRQLRGRWFREDGSPVSEISGALIIWEGAWQEPTLLVESAPNEVCMEVQDAVFFGQVTLQPQASISWSDGDLWLHK
ncbi:unnamed protein product [Effrenium voratum]|uniref:Uncharacterized protein n=1 Tax=Effrenium voratum TaxID=2562239 RepID=A0AA36HXU1_9DINO|nr:unnamed protein product [Effrenium voratum]CAJ1430599.1 unnamed protein product [Effrenium voratum]CAJ1456023.1 unnamed protein product [Effrenium voratum]